MANKYIVVFRMTDGGPEMRIVTTNLEDTIAMLEASGYVIIDIIDVG